MCRVSKRWICELQISLDVRLVRCKTRNKFDWINKYNDFANGDTTVKGPLYNFKRPSVIAYKRNASQHQPQLTHGWNKISTSPETNTTRKYTKTEYDKKTEPEMARQGAGNTTKHKISLMPNSVPQPLLLLELLLHQIECPLIFRRFCQQKVL